MTLTKKEITNWISHLKKDSQEAYQTAIDLFKSKHFHFSLFFCHLAIEKILKASFISKHKKFAPPVHDLIFLQKKIGLVIEEELLKQLVEINTFNIRARYEDYKKEFYRKATREYAEEWLKNTENILEILTKYL